MKMITKKQIEDAGYTVLTKGGWFYVNPEIIPHDWHDVCKDFGIDEGAKGAYLCIVGVKEDNEGDEND
jgi:hypothetical protein